MGYKSCKPLFQSILSITEWLHHSPRGLCTCLQGLKLPFSLKKKFATSLHPQHIYTYQMEPSTLLVACLVLVVTFFITSVVFPPWSFPRDIPTIPFYVSFLGTYTSMDQREIYEAYLREPLEKYGCVKIFFANRWNILVVRPDLLNQVLRDEKTFAKSGNHKKIPNAVLSEYTGDNVISAHGEQWRLYRDVVQKSIQFPIKSHVYCNTKKLMSLIMENSLGGQSIAVSDYLQRLALANVGQCMLGMDLHTLDGDCELHTRLKAVKAQIFKPLYMNFPFLDSFPIRSRLEARKTVRQFRTFYKDLVIAAQMPGNCNTDSAAYKLYSSYKNGILTEKQMIDNLVIILVAGHENPQIFFTSLLYCMAKHQDIQQRLREELQDCSADELETKPYLTAMIFETLRYLPPLGQIINKCATKDCLLGSSIAIPKGAYVGYNNYATTHSASAWIEPASFKPERWGDDLAEILSEYKHAKSRATLPSFHGGKRACLGEKFALFEGRIFVYGIIRHFKVRLDPDWEDKLTPAGPVSPLGLRCVFEVLPVVL